ncbi:uncharacterized protein LOC113231895 [Hyposmocoma kahamanoa]|uniref:uncharacterized protein LOC113231895 n=2 Tax=Hyposmocoma kahamanoa TaxID=1477025 RepID=UPI000E6D6A52|nr:uncharacterized protein LOC113231895 [Hyposmocoma kahamanoa]
MKAATAELFGSESDEEEGCSTGSTKATSCVANAVKCDMCNIEIPQKKYHYHMRTNVHKENCLLKTEFKNIDIIKTAFKNRIVTYRINPAQEVEYLTPEAFLYSYKNDVSNVIHLSILKHTCLKLNFELFAYFELPRSSTQQLKSFNTKFDCVFNNTNINELYMNAIETFKQKLSEFEHCESGWSLVSISHLELNINKYCPMRGGTFIELPSFLKNSKSCINIQNKDEYCFLWSIVAALFPAKSNVCKTSSYPHHSTVFKTDGMTFPPSCKDIQLFEANNNISINIYGLSSSSLVTGPLYLSKNRKNNHVNLLYFEKGVKGHYCLIKDLVRLVKRQISKFKGNLYMYPAYYVTSPSLSWDAMLLSTGIELDLIDDLEMYQMLEKGIRGGLVQCSLRHAKANNKYLPEFDDFNPSSYLIYLDCNNLYGHAMTKSLPYSEFKFLNKYEIETFNILTVPENGDTGFILEVDLEYPENLHNLHSDLPFAPEKFIPPGGKSPKLIASLYDKYNYVVHFIHLKEMLRNGLILRNIHRILSFKQSNFLQKYIDLNTNLRQSAVSVFEKDFFKLMNNAIFGKTIENRRKQVSVKLITTWKDEYNLTKKRLDAETLISRPNLKNISVFSENFLAAQFTPEKIVLDRPIYIGFSVLEYAKQHLYKFHYDFIKKIYNQNAKLCYTDTDSLLYLIFTEDVYRDIKNNLSEFDTSNFDLNNPYCIERVNAKIPGLFKDELGGDVIREFVGLRAKLYSLNSIKTRINKAKGVSKCVTKNLTLSQYKDSLFNVKDLKYLKEQLVKSVDNIKNKIKMIQCDEDEANLKYKNVFKSITEPLETLLKNKKSIPTFTMSTKIDETGGSEDLNSSTDYENFKDIINADSSDHSEYYEYANDASKRLLNESNGNDTLLSLKKEDMMDMYEHFNVPFGIQTKNKKLMMGNSAVSLSYIPDASHAEKRYIITINDKKYELTAGLKELLMRNKPDLTIVTEKDKSEYKEMLINTNAHKRDFDPNGKLKDLVKKLPQLKSGGYLPELKQYKSNTDYIYWDDPNELIERLKLLIASKSAGNNNHENEIVSIIEELKEADKAELPDIVSKDYVDKIVKKNSDNLVHIEKLILILVDRIKDIEKDIALKGLEGKLNKHYEQSRRR